MTRTYGSVRPKQNHVYTVEDVQNLYSVSRNTITNWVNAGLRQIDDSRPQLFRGAELKRFHRERALKNTRKLRVGEFKCAACQARVTPLVQTLQIHHGENRRPAAWARCPECGAYVIRFLNDTQCIAYQACIDSNTSLLSLDESKGRDPAGIVNNSEIASILWNGENARIIHEYQLYGGAFFYQDFGHAPCRNT